MPFRQVARRCARPQNPEDAVEHAPALDTRHASGFLWWTWLDHAPFEGGQIISAHTHAESRLEMRWKRCTPQLQTFMSVANVRP